MGNVKRVIYNKYDKKEIFKDYNSLVKHNNLIQGKYTLSASEQKFVYKLFEIIQKRNYSSREISFKFDTIYKDYSGIVDKNITKHEFKNLIEGIQNNQPRVIIGDQFIRTQWYAIKGDLDYNEITLIIDEHIFKYIQAIEENFTKLDFASIYSFTTFFAMRIYELLKQWSGTRQGIVFKLDYFKELLEIQDKYKRYYDLDKYVLKKSTEQINEKSDIFVEYKPIRKGRSVESIEFTIREKKENIETSYQDKKDVIEERHDNKNMNLNKKEFFIPEEISLSDKLKNLFKIEFGEYNFSEPKYYKLLLEAEEIALKKDNSSKIVATNYELFSSILRNKISYLKAKEDAIGIELIEMSLSEEQLEEMQILDMNPVTFLERIIKPDKKKYEAFKAVYEKCEKEKDRITF
ncbi:replication initiation protein [Clostridioides difficile]|uniref:replication initiation protein n=1 Tax=Clostridioides difficile TaxID=1496 RepID=UPI001C17F76B|nr:replication initiation protein [Clostridioides difficile]HBE9109966.1 replication initiation protein [Clostridioides difficile]HBF5457067.1 replication initiation protein [Clostridioides difficile]